MRAQVIEVLKRQLEAREAARVTALAQEGDGKAPAKLASLLGDAIVGATEDVLRLHGVYLQVPVPWSAFPIRRVLTLRGRALRQTIAPVGAREERLAANEALFREVNERVAEVAEQFVASDSRDRVDFSCECADRGCAEQIAMTLREYEALRAAATHFAVVPGHETEIERVVERHSNYLVVEKEHPDAEEVARETNRRLTGKGRAAS
jgi:hypothetical protein